MSSQTLPDNFDVIVIGTGLEESVVAAAAARNGHSVLHVDENDYYGGDWTAFTLQGLQDWVANLDKEQESEEIEDFSRFLRDGEEVSLMNRQNSFTEVKTDWLVKDETASRWNKAKIEENGRKFNIDLSPRLLFSRGSMVELLISSNISRYAEFKATSRVLTILKDGGLEHVPSSRADVFATKHISVVEKRILMKFITFCVDFESHPEIWENFKTRPFLDFLKHQKLTENLINFVINSIAMVGIDASSYEGLRSTQKFLNSIGRFGNTPFLWSMYGAGELPQAFCRLCAVFGGTYFLGKRIQAVTYKLSEEGEEITGIIFNGQRISCKKLVMDVRKCPISLKKVPVTKEVVNRKAFLLSDSVMPSEKEQLTFVSVPPETPDGKFTYYQEVGFGTAACPKGMYVMHATTSGSEINEKRVINDDEKILFSFGFKNEVEVPVENRQNNLFFCSGPIFELDFDAAIQNSRVLYKAMYEDEEFLPRAPDPEEIVIGGGDESSGLNEENQKDD